jgi:hypothetical protein
MGEFEPSMESRSMSGRACSLSVEDLRTGDLGRILSRSEISLSVKVRVMSDSRRVGERGDGGEQFGGIFARNIMFTGIGSILDPQVSP